MSSEEAVEQIQIERGEASPEQIKEVEAGQFLTPQEFAEKVRYSYQWVLWMCTTGRIKAIKPLGSRWRIPRSEYERILREGTPALPKKVLEKPPVTEIAVDEQRVKDKVKEKPEDKPPTLFGLDFSGLFSGGKKQ